MATKQHSEITGEDALHPATYVQGSDPGAVGAHKLWWDTTDDSLRVRNDADTDWLLLAPSSNAITNDPSADQTITSGGATVTPLIVKAHASQSDPLVQLATSADVESLALVLGGVRFPATQEASANANTLDDYEEGAWTPVLTFGTPGNLSVAYTSQSGTYTKVGRLVAWRLQLVTSAFTHTTASGNLVVSGLPYAATGNNYVGACALQGYTKANFTQITSEVIASDTTMQFRASGSGQTMTFLAFGDMPTAGTVVIRAGGTYFTA